MRDYESGRWGFKLIWGLRASVFPRALALAVPNAAIAFCLGWYIQASEHDKELTDNAFSIWAGFSSVLFFVLYFRSNVAYNRWWEGGTLLQQTRGEWFNAYSSLIAFTSPEPSKEAEVEAYQHMLARLMSLLFCSALQQVSPNRNRPFEIIDSAGIDPKSLYFLSESNDRVEVILQWVQRSTILNMASGVLPIPPPVMSRAFQEISRGIVNLQNARKIADFPFPFPYAQTSIVMLLIHWAMCPVLSSILLNHVLAAITCFSVVFFLWCINFIALELESPFGSEDNDLPMDQMQIDWNQSIATLLAKRANQPPHFAFNAPVHRKLEISMSDGSYVCGKQRLSIAELEEMGGQGRRGSEGDFSLCGCLGGRRGGGGGGGDVRSMQTSTRQLGTLVGIADPEPDGDVDGSDCCGENVCKGAENHSGAESLGNHDQKVAEPNGPVSECSSRQSSVSRRSRDGRKKLQGNQLHGVLASNPTGGVPVQGSMGSAASAPSDIREQAKRDKVSISQATAAALTARRPGAAAGSAAVRSATAPASSSASSSSGQGPDVALADKLITNCTGNRLVINCPGMECFSPFPRPKKPRNTHSKQARGGRLDPLSGEDPQINE